MEAATNRSSPLRRLLIIAAAILAIMLALRDQSARALENHVLASIGSFWTKHPEQLGRAIALDAAAAARTGHQISRPGLARTATLHRVQPLSTTPLMIAGAEAQISGDRVRAERLYAAARTRNPRDPAARLLLADSLLRRGAIRPGLEEMLALARVMPNTSGPVAPALAAFARNKGAEESLRPVLASHPSLRSQVLVTLAQDSANVPLVLRLAPSPTSEPGLDRPWEGIMLNSLVASGKVAEARALWHDLTGLGRRDSLIVNRSFANWKAPPPFNWETPETAGGIAEFGEKQGLAVIYYGRDDVVLARQLLALSAGKYRLVTRTDGSDPTDSIAWSLRCASGTSIAILKLSRNGGGDAQFDIPKDCPAQWIELKGIVPDAEATVETRLLSVDIQKVAG